MSHKRIRQELNAKIAILGDYIARTTKELSNAIDEMHELKEQLKELDKDENQ